MNWLVKQEIKAGLFWVLAGPGLIGLMYFVVLALVRGAVVSSANLVNAPETFFMFSMVGGSIPRLVVTVAIVQNARNRWLKTGTLEDLITTPGGARLLLFGLLARPLTVLTVFALFEALTVLPLMGLMGSMAAWGGVMLAAKWMAWGGAAVLVSCFAGPRTSTGRIAIGLAIAMYAVRFIAGMVSVSGSASISASSRFQVTALLLPPPLARLAELGTASRVAAEGFIGDFYGSVVIFAVFGTLILTNQLSWIAERYRDNMEKPASRSRKI